MHGLRLISIKMFLLLLGYSMIVLRTQEILITDKNFSLAKASIRGKISTKHIFISGMPFGQHV